MLDVLSFFLDYGGGVAAIAVLLFSVAAFVLRDWKKIDNLEERIEKLETEFRQTMVDMVARCEESLSNSSRALSQNGKILQEIITKVVK